ncbi:MAG: cytochrome c-type biogenesis CcmF C-terminal domain-containing protein, partial [Solirubrobacteraceae bacterium]
HDLLRLARRGALARLPRRVGGQVVHLGVALIAVGIAVSSAYQVQAQATLRPGETMRIAGREIRLDALRTIQEPRREVLRATLSVDGDRRLEPALNRYRNASDAEAAPAIRTGPIRDVYAILVDVAPAGSAATIRVLLNPLVSWIWAGGAVMLAGAAIAAWPRARQLRRAAT